MVGTHCLAPVRLTELAARSRGASASELSHIATCETCATAVHQPSSQFARRWDVRSWMLSLTLPMLAALCWLVLAAPYQGAHARVHGDAALFASVQRNGAAIRTEVPLEQLTDLNAGDRITLQIAGAEDQWVVLQGWEDPRWASYFSGRTPPGGRLPVALGVSDAGETRVRLWVCNEEPHVSTADLRGWAACEAHLYAF